MVSILISDNGLEVPTSRDALRIVLEYRAPDFDIVSYAVRNCGWLHLRWTGRLLRIRVRPKTFTRAAFNRAVAHMLPAQRGTRFVFEDEEKKLPIKVLFNVNDAVAQLEGLMNFADEEPARESFFAEQLALSRLQHPKRHVLRRLLENWVHNHAFLPSELATPFREARAGERFVVAHTTRQRCTVLEFGMGITVFGPGWSEQVVGRELEDQPDGHYGERSAETYHRVFRTGVPRFELIDAIIKPPDGQLAQRCRYERLVLPWRSATGDMFVSGTSYLRTRFHFPA